MNQPENISTTNELPPFPESEKELGYKNSLLGDKAVAESLEPTQQRLPDGLNTSLEEALQAKTKDQVGAALLQLYRSIELAQELGYL